MSDRRFFVLAHEQARAGAMRAIHEAADGFVVKIEPPAKSREQENKYHAMIGEIARHWRFMGHKVDADDAKRLLVDAFAKAMRDAGTPLHHDGRVVPSLDGERVVQLGIQTSKFYTAEASEFIEFLGAWAAVNGIEFGEVAV